MRIEVIAGNTISQQARTYAEYRLFAALSQMVDTKRVRHVRVVLRHLSQKGTGARASCTVTLFSDRVGHVRVRAVGDHLYAAINRAADSFGDSRATPASAGASRAEEPGPSAHYLAGSSGAD